MTQCPNCQTEFSVSPGAAIPYACPNCRQLVLATYCELERIAGGSMGEVYRARRPNMGNRPVAIKIPREANTQHLQRFEREIAASANLSHENIVRAFDCGKIEGQPYLVMELVSGRSLTDILRTQSPLSVVRVLQILRGVAAGLAHAQQQGIVNRDIKPENILLTEDNTAKILDYGLAVIPALDGTGEHVTRSGSLLGTPAFMAPEQCRDPHNVTIAADVYSLGCTGFFLLTNELPFRGTATDVSQLHATAPRPSVRRVRTDVPSEVDELLREMMAIFPSERPSPPALVRRLDQMLAAFAAQAFSPTNNAFARTNTTAAEPHQAFVVGEVLDGDDEIPEVLPEVFDGSVPIEDSTATVANDASNTSLQKSTRGTASASPSATAAKAAAPSEEVFAIPLDAVVEATHAIDAFDGSVPATAESQPATTDQPAATKRPRTAREIAAAKKRQFRTIVGAVAAFIIVGTAIAYPFIFPKPDPVKSWTAAQDDYQLRKWTPAIKQFTQFPIDFPDHAHAADVPFFLDMCEAGKDVFSQTGDPGKGLATIEALFQKYRDTPQYEAYRADLYTNLQRLIERFVELADKTQKPEWLDGGKRAHSLLATVGQGMTDNWVPQKTADLATLVADAAKRLEAVVAKKELLALITTAQDPEIDLATLDATQEQIKATLKKFPNITDDPLVKESLGRRFEGEVKRVRYVRATAEDGEPAEAELSHSDRNIHFVVWDKPAGSPVVGDVQLALARGVLYAFDGNGNHLWSRRLGFDSQRIPLAIPASPNSPAAFIAVSALDNTLIALAQNTGHELWKYSPGAQELSAPLTISRWRAADNKPELVRGLLPTANGQIHVLELARGKSLGRFETGLPLTVGGAFDPQSRRLYFPAESRRLLVLDPAVIDSPQPTAPATSVLLTNHASGSLRSPPVVVGRYLVLTESSDLDRTRVRVFETTPGGEFLDPEAAPLKEISLRGWSWFTPPTTPDRITVVTDEGDLGVYGFNLDNATEAIFPIVEDKSRTVARAAGDAFRALAIHSDEHLLWIMAEGQLRHLALDMLNQRFKPVWPAASAAAPIAGVPLHEASFQRSAQRIFVTTRSAQRDEVLMSAVNADDGALIWQRQLGTAPATDPWLVGNRIVLLDRCGRLLQIEKNADETDLNMTHDAPAPPAAANQQMLWLPDSFAADAATDGASGWLLLQLDPQGKQLAMRNLGKTLNAAADSAGWIQLNLPGVALHGRPAVLGTSLIAPCSDGRLHRIALDGTSINQRNEQPFAWIAENAVVPEQTARLYPLAENRLLLLDGRQARWLEAAVTNGVEHWKQIGSSFIAAANLVNEPLFTKDFILLTDASHHVYRLARDKPEVEPPHWKLPASISGSPLLAGTERDHVLLVLDQQRLVSFDLRAPHAAEPKWSVELKSRLCGRPIASKNVVLVTEESGHVTGLRVDSGQAAGSVSLGHGVIPAAAAVPYGKGKIVVPLADGTLLWTAIRPPAKKEK